MDSNAASVYDFCFFKKAQEPSHGEVLQALSLEHVVLISRRLFAHEEEALHYHPVKTKNPSEWADKLRPWHTERRHIYLICHQPNSTHLITSSAEPNKSIKPWPIKFSQPTDMLATQDVSAVKDITTWKKYDAAAVILPKHFYSAEKVSQTIKWFRQNPPNKIYSINKESGYDCQASSRDILQIVNPDIDAKNLMLPNNTTILAFHSQTSVSLPEISQTAIPGEVYLID